MNLSGLTEWQRFTQKHAGRNSVPPVELQGRFKTCQWRAMDTLERVSHLEDTWRFRKTGTWPTFSVGRDDPHAERRRAPCGKEEAQTWRDMLRVHVGVAANPPKELMRQFSTTECVGRVAYAARGAGVRRWPHHDHGRRLLLMRLRVPAALKAHVLLRENGMTGVESAGLPPLGATHLLEKAGSPLHFHFATLDTNGNGYTHPFRSDHQHLVHRGEVLPVRTEEHTHALAPIRGPVDASFLQENPEPPVSTASGKRRWWLYLLIGGAVV
jgi:hypothetical protein